jgi:hypothetical protein
MPGAGVEGAFFSSSAKQSAKSAEIEESAGRSMAGESNGFRSQWEALFRAPAPTMSLGQSGGAGQTVRMVAGIRAGTAGNEAGTGNSTESATGMPAALDLSPLLAAPAEVAGIKLGATAISNPIPSPNAQAVETDPSQQAAVDGIGSNARGSASAGKTANASEMQTDARARTPGFQKTARGALPTSAADPAGVQSVGHLQAEGSASFPIVAAPAEQPTAGVSWRLADFATGGLRSAASAVMEPSVPGPEFFLSAAENPAPSGRESASGPRNALNLPAAPVGGKGTVQPAKLASQEADVVLEPTLRDASLDSDNEPAGVLAAPASPGIAQSQASPIAGRHEFPNLVSAPTLRDASLDSDNEPAGVLAASAAPAIAQSQASPIASRHELPTLLNASGSAESAAANQAVLPGSGAPATPNVPSIAARPGRKPSGSAQPAQPAESPGIVPERIIGAGKPAAPAAHSDALPMAKLGPGATAPALPVMARIVGAAQEFPGPVVANRVDVAEGAATPSAEFSGKDVFANIDSGTGVSAPAWVHAGSQHAEAGFDDPALGWVGVRAGMTGSEIHAALLPESAGAAQALSAHLSGLTTYLSEQHTPVSAVTMAAPGTNGLASSVDPGGQQDPNQNGGESSSGAASAAEQQGSNRSTAVDSPAELAVGGELAGLPSLDGLRGRQISVVV